jgi:methyltransferase family protein
MEWSRTVADYHPVFPRPRWGHGQPDHPRISAVLEQGRPRYAATLNAFARYRVALHRIPFAQDRAKPDSPFWNNIWFSALDGAALVAFLLSGNVHRYVEIGSGHSTLFARFAIRSATIPTTITSIDPRPRADIDALCDRLLRKRLEECDIEEFLSLESGDILFFDGSHRVFSNSDVTVFFLEVLPRLKPGVLVHIHDIFLPADYPPSWNERLYSEQYLLAAMLLFGNPPFRVVLPNYFVCSDPSLSLQVKDLFRAPRGGQDIPFTYPHTNRIPGLSFWLETGNEA